MARLLLVDDDGASRLICRRFFAKRAPGVVVEEVADGESALEALGRGRFDCILADYRMGAVSGIDVLARAAEAQPDAKRVLMSGFADAALVEGARRRARIDGFLEKPISFAEFEAALAERVLPFLAA